MALTLVLPISLPGLMGLWWDFPSLARKSRRQPISSRVKMRVVLFLRDWSEKLR